MNGAIVALLLLPAFAMGAAVNSGTKAELKTHNDHAAGCGDGAKECLESSEALDESLSMSLLQVATSIESITEGGKAITDVTKNQITPNIDLDTWYARKDSFLKKAGMLTGADRKEPTADGLQEGGARGHDREEMRAVYDALARDESIQTICETGFNAGDSAMRFLAQSNATLYEFDLGRYDYSLAAANFTKDNFPGRFHITWGDSSVTVPAFHKAHPEVKCDLVIVDGGHSYDIALADLTNFMSMAAEKHVLFLDDTPCSKEYCIGVNRAWGKLLNEGCVVEDKVVSVSEWYGFRKGAYQDFNCTLSDHSSGHALLLSVFAVFPIFAVFTF